MNPHQHSDYDPIDWGSPNSHSALSGDDYLGDLPGENPELDHRLKKEIISSLQESQISCSQLNISVKDGFVSLTGKVNSEAVRKSIVGTIEAIDGIDDVACFVQVEKDPDLGVPSPS